MKSNSNTLGIFLLYFVSHTILRSESIASFQKCNSYSFDQCLINGKDVIEEVHNTSPDQCQFFCSNIYKDSCSFFMLKEDSLDCLLFNITLNSFLMDCEKIGGPLQPSIQECIETNDPCEVINFLTFLITGSENLLLIKHQKMKFTCKKWKAEKFFSELC